MKKKNRSKSKSKFRQTRRGYSTLEVDSYINTLEGKAVQYSKLEKSFFELKAHCEKIEAELKELKSRENDIVSSLQSANEKANELKVDLRVQYAMEIERLKLFQAKWTNCYEEIKERYKFDKDALNMESIVATTAVEIEDMLYQDFRIPKESRASEIEKQFKSEVKRLGMDDFELSHLFEKMKGELESIEGVKQSKTSKFSANSDKYNFDGLQDEFSKSAF